VDTEEEENDKDGSEVNGKDVKMQESRLSPLPEEDEMGEMGGNMGEMDGDMEEMEVDAQIGDYLRGISGGHDESMGDNEDSEKAGEMEDSVRKESDGSAGEGGSGKGKEGEVVDQVAGKGDEVTGRDKGAQAPKQSAKKRKAEGKWCIFHVLSMRPRSRLGSSYLPQVHQTR
jgi:hypothetical protein